MENETSLELKADHLRAALKCAAKLDVRYYFNGVCIEVGPDFINYVGTDGHKLFVCQHAAEVPPAFVGKRFILSRAAMRLAGVEMVLIEKLDGKQAAGRLVKRRTTEPFVWEVIDGRYPDWHQVVPQKSSGKPDQYDGSLLNDLHEAFAELGATFSPHLTPNGDGSDRGGGPALLTYGGLNALGVVMPFRSTAAADVEALRTTLTRPLTSVAAAA